MVRCFNVEEDIVSSETLASIAHWVLFVGVCVEEQAVNCVVVLDLHLLYSINEPSIVLQLTSQLLVFMDFKSHHQPFEEVSRDVVFTEVDSEQAMAITHCICERQDVSS